MGNSEAAAFSGGPEGPPFSSLRPRVCRSRRSQTGRWHSGRRVCGRPGASSVPTGRSSAGCPLRSAAAMKKPSRPKPGGLRALTARLQPLRAFGSQSSAPISGTRWGGTAPSYCRRDVYRYGGQPGKLLAFSLSSKGDSAWSRLARALGTGRHTLRRPVGIPIPKTP